MSETSYLDLLPPDITSSVIDDSTWGYKNVMKNAVKQTNNRSASDSHRAKDISNYSIGKFKYPEDVGTSPDLQHSIVFFINVRGNSRSKQKDNTLFELSDEQTVTKTGFMVATGLATAGAVAVPLIHGASSLASSAMRRKAVGHLSGSTSVLEQQAARKAANVDIANTFTSSTAAAGKIAAVGAVMGATALTFQETSLYRLKDAITLAIQEPPKVSYKVNYDRWDAGTLLGGSSSASSISEFAAMGQAGLMKFATLPSVVGAPDFSKGMQKMAGQSPNPFKTALFVDVDLRHFSYHYKFMPKTKNEADNVRNIIKTFKTHMHPEFSSGKVFLIHPSEFNIVYYYKGKENTSFNKISTCVLTEMEVDAGEQQLATFQDGMSVEVNMKLTFMETEMMTREKIEQGY